ncbi:MAG: alpha/beta hydrolase [Nitrospira sp.]|nr:alpha/beta hydrolase [Nitrospira sp.]
MEEASAKDTAAADSQMKAVLDELTELSPKPIETLSADDAREQPTPGDAVMKLLKKQGKSTDPQPVGDVENRKIPGADGKIPVRVYTPEGTGPFPIIVYYHGGGWVIATIDTYDSSARALASAANAIVVAVEYRKAPEYRFPAAHEDAYTAYVWTLEHAQEIKGDSSKVAVAGESAGGNLAAAVSMMARDRGKPLPVHQLLIYPVAGYDFNTPSYQKNANAKPLNKAMMPWFFEKYLRSPSDAEHPHISLTKAANLQGLPPATIIAAEIDPLQSEGRQYADKLQATGVPVTYKNFPGVTHEFFGMSAVLDKAKQAVALAATELKQSFRNAAHSMPQPMPSHSAR